LDISIEFENGDAKPCNDEPDRAKYQLTVSCCSLVPRASQKVPEVDRIELLRRVSIFAGIDHIDLATISRACQWSTIANDQTIIEASEPSTDIFFVAQGAVSAKAYSTDGREVTFAYIRSGEMFGEFSAIDGKPRSARIEPLEPSIIARMRADEFRAVLLRHPGVGLLLAEHLVSKLRGLTRRVFEYSTLPVRLRIRAELLRYCATTTLDGNTAIIDPAPTHQEMATQISTHREAVSRELGQLVADGIIRTSRRKIHVLDINRLSSRLDPLLTN
jgi:CRP/FNR family cyclic AMP-dependent transcriptional regulator